MQTGLADETCIFYSELNNVARGQLIIPVSVVLAKAAVTVHAELPGALTLPLLQNLETRPPKRPLSPRSVHLGR